MKSKTLRFSPLVILAVWVIFGPVEDLRGQSEPPLSEQEAGRFARLALDCVHQEYPNKIAHVLAGDSDVRPPRELTPAFYGCYDWHSSVHGHWLLARLARLFPQAEFAAEARRRLGTSLSAERIAAEVKYLSGPGRVSFERPYGLAWLLQLGAELREWSAEAAVQEPSSAEGASSLAADTAQWVLALEPLEELSARRIAEWLPKLDYAIRTGEHSQTAFAFGLILDWARVAEAEDLEELLMKRILSLYGSDKDCPLAYEPSGQDFLSPCIAQADLLRRVMRPEIFALWLSEFLPSLSSATSAGWLPVALVSDRSDPKLAHLDGLNLSRAWMLAGIASGLPPQDARRQWLLAASQAHRLDALPAVTGEHYEGGHWLGSFATYLVTQRGY